MREYFELGKCNEGGGVLLLVTKVIERTATALKISARTLKGIGLENQFVDKTGPSRLVTPSKKRKYEKRIIKLDTFQIDAIRRHVYNFLAQKENPTLESLLVSSRD